MSKVARTPLIDKRQVGVNLLGLRLLESKVNLKVPSPQHRPASLAALEKELGTVVLLDISLPTRRAETFHSVIRKASDIRFVGPSEVGIDGKRLLPTLSYTIKPPSAAGLQVSGGSGLQWRYSPNNTNSERPPQFISLLASIEP